MNQAHAGDTPYRVPRETSRWRSVALAAAMHAGLFLCLWISVQWQNTVPVTEEAEVWDMKTQSAAPPPDPTTDPEPVKPTPVTPPPPPVAAQPVEAPQPDVPPPDIALERKKAKLKAEQQELAEKQRQQQIREDQEEADRQAKAKADAKEAKAKQLADAKADAKAKALADAKAAKQQEDLDKAREAQELAAVLKADKTRKANEQKAAEKARAQNIARMQDALGSGGSGAAAKSTGARSDSGYVAAITTKIKSNIAYNASDDAAGNPRAVYKIEQLPTGEIISVRKIKSSGIPAYDSAVENAIAKSSPLPKKKDGTVEREVEAGFNLKDLP